jgi:DNA-binding beta-propeller fold protein YncE
MRSQLVKLLQGMQFAIALVAVQFCMLGMSSAQPSPNAPLATASAFLPLTPGTISPVRAFPALRLTRGLELTYIGMFSPDAVYRKSTTFDGRVAGEGIRPASNGDNQQLSEVPSWMLLSTERIVESLEPPAHAKAVPSVHSRTANTRNHVVTYIYGRSSVIQAPVHLTTDSQERLIVSDPKGFAVHVLDRNGKTSMRLVTGKGYRLHVPAGVAVDSSDNIYVADSEHGMVVVFDSAGNFVRYLGSHQGEPEYARPHGLAMIPGKQHLLLVDSPRNLVIELDLEGHELKRAGKNRDGSGAVEFDAPTDIAVNHDHIFVLDRSGTRIQVLDMSLNPETRFDLPRGRDPREDLDNGLSADAEGNVYVSYHRSSMVRVYNPGGHLLASFGQAGVRVGEFAAPEGLWVDSANCLYVADSGNGRVQLFQLKSSH